MSAKRTLSKDLASDGTVTGLVLTGGSPTVAGEPSTDEAEGRRADGFDSAGLEPTGSGGLGRGADLTLPFPIPAAGDDDDEVGAG